jgi:hypothetical protein
MGRVRVGNSLLEPRPAFGRTVLVTFDPIQNLLSGINHKRRWIVAEEALAHIDDGLLGRGGGSLIDQSPDIMSDLHLVALLAKLLTKHPVVDLLP